MSLWILGLFASPGWTASAVQKNTKLTGVYLGGGQKGAKWLGPIWRIENAGKKTIRLKGLRIFGGGLRVDHTQLPERIASGQDFDPSGNFKRSFSIRLNGETTLKPEQVLWIANRADRFKQVYGFLPDAEVENTESTIRDMVVVKGPVRHPQKLGFVGVTDQSGVILDCLVYETSGEFEEEFRFSGPWDDAPVHLNKRVAYSPFRYLIRRDRSGSGKLLPDTDTHNDWNSGFSSRKLGEEVDYRIELPGQLNWVPKKLHNVKADIWATSAPDNNYQAFIRLIDKAEKSIWVSIYQMTNPNIAKAFHRALKRGVELRIWLEGAPVGGIPDQERFLLNELVTEGAKVYFLGGEKKLDLQPRYRFDHSKYTIVDEKIVVIGTENYGRTGVPVQNDYGNRGWMIQIQQPEFVAQLQKVWQHDVRPNTLLDVIPWEKDPRDAYGLPYRKPDFKPNYVIPTGDYKEPVRPLHLKGKVDLELVLAPNNSLNTEQGLLAMILRAKKTLDIEQNSIVRYWGRKKDKVRAQNLPLEAVISAARRGVRVRVLLDGTWYNISGDNLKNNDNTVAYLNDLAAKENLPLMAKVINLGSTNLSKIHAKGVLLDGKEVFVGSINWTENSFKGNREVGVVVGDRRVTGYYQNLFERDWRRSTLYTGTIKNDEPVPVRSAPLPRAKVLKKLKTGDKVVVLGEYQKKWAQVRGGKKDILGYLPLKSIGYYDGSPWEAINLIDRYAKISGKVVAVREGKKTFSLIFGDEKHPIFTGIIFKKMVGKLRQQGLPDPKSLKGKHVALLGKVQQYRVPEIIVFKKKQIQILGSDS